MQVQLPDGTIGEFPDDMPQEQIEGVLKQQFPQDSQTVAPVQTPETLGASPQQLLEDGKIYDYYSKVDGKVEHFSNEKKQPGFLKTLDMINTGVHRGVTHFTLGVMSMLPFGDKYQKALKKVDSDVEAEQQKNIKTYDSWAPQGGELVGELLATAPAGGLLGGVAKGANALANVAPTGLKALSRYGTAGIGGAGVLSGTEAVEYQGGEFDFGKAGEKFKEGMTSPLSYVAPMAGQALGRYLDKSRTLSDATGSGIPVLPRDLLEKSSWKTVVNMALDSFSTLVPLGERAKQLQNLVPAIGQVIRKIAGNTVGKSTDELTTYAGKNLQMGLQRSKAKETILWSKDFKDANISNMDELLPYIQDFKDEISSVALPTYNRSLKLVDKNLDKILSGKGTFEDIKNIGSIIGDSASDAYSLGAGTGKSLGDTIAELRRNLMEKASGNLSKDQLFDWKAAKTFSTNQYALEDAIPQVKTAIKSQIEANKIVEGILKDSTSFDKDLAMGIMSKKGQMATKAAKISEALSKASSESGQLNLDMFLKNVTIPDTIEATSRSASATKNLLGDEYEYIKGMTRHLKSINEAKKVGNVGKYVIPVVGAGALSAAGASDNLSIDDFKAVAPYAAVLFASNHPILKRLLGASTRKLSDSTYKHITNKVQDIFTRAGYLYNEDGSMSKKGDE